MGEREILLADSDSEVREQLAESFREAGYRVETTESTVHLFCTVLEKQIPVVLLGSGCDRKIALPELVPLLKKCNRRVTIILVSDEESLPAIRTLRQEGIFYHALTPSSRDDTEEILAAVRCAFNRPVPEFSMHQALAADSREDTEENPAAGQCPSGQPVTGDDTSGITEVRHGEVRKMKTKTMAIVTTLTAAVAGSMYYALAASVGGDYSEFLIWSFLGFCALIVVGQLLPMVFSLREAGKGAQETFAASREEEAEVATEEK